MTNLMLMSDYTIIFQHNLLQFVNVMVENVRMWRVSNIFGEIKQPVNQSRENSFLKVPVIKLK